VERSGASSTQPEGEYRIFSSISFVIPATSSGSSSSNRLFPDSIFIVQNRPETVWSQEDRETNVEVEGDDTLDYIKYTYYI